MQLFAHILGRRDDLEERLASHGVVTLLILSECFPLTQGLE